MGEGAGQVPVPGSEDLEQNKGFFLYLVIQRLSAIDDFCSELDGFSEHRMNTLPQAKRDTRDNRQFCSMRLNLAERWSLHNQ